MTNVKFILLHQMHHVFGWVGLSGVGGKQASDTHSRYGVSIFRCASVSFINYLGLGNHVVG